MGKLINIDDLKLPQHFFERIDNVPKFYEWLEKQPPADAVPVRHGHWIFSPKDAIDMMFTLPKCSECRVESADGGNYCSNCGAKMDERQE